MSAERILNELLLLDLDTYGDQPTDVLLCELMHRHRLRIWEVAEWLGVSESAVARWRRGLHAMPWAAWLALHAQLYRLALAAELKD